MSIQKPVSTSYNQFMTLGVFGLVCALAYYVQKDVKHQITEIKAEAITQQSIAPQENQTAGIQIVCPRSKYEGEIYYSQYYEDFILNYVFADRTKGTYIDIGAADPTHWNMAHLFYEKGWRGINIDPMPSYAEIYKEKRPEDLFLNLCF